MNYHTCNTQMGTHSVKMWVYVCVMLCLGMYTCILKGVTRERKREREREREREKERERKKEIRETCY